MNDDLKKGGKCAEEFYEVIKKAAAESDDESLFWAGLMTCLSGYAVGSIGFENVSAILQKAASMVDFVGSHVESVDQVKH
jgi:hypothetical protein